MIRVTAYCDVCRSNIDCVVEAGKMHSVASAFAELHNPDCFYQQEEAPSGGQDQGKPRQQEDHPIDARDEGGAASGASGERIGRA